MIAACGIALTVVFAFRVARTAQPRVRYVIAVLAFVAAAVAPFWPRSTSLPARAEARAHTVAQVAARANAPITAAVSLVDNSGAKPYALLAWIVIAAALVLREGIGHAVLHFRRREWDPAPFELKEALSWPDDVPLFLAENDGPSTIGLLHPVVVLPSAWIETLTTDHAARVARHELAHARWRDPLFNAIIRIVRAILWPSVPLWFLERVIRTEREVAADVFAIADNPNAVADYASSLVDAAARCRPRYRVATALGNGIGLEERVARLFSFKRPSVLRLTLAALVLLTGTAAIVAVPDAPLQSKPTLHPIPARATPQYEQSARAMNEILDRTRFHNHEGTRSVHELLGRIRGSRTVQPILDALNAKDRRTRESVAWIAGELGDASMVPALIERLKDTDPHVQQTSAWALGMIGDPRAVRPLIAALQSKDASARHGAAWALGRLVATDAVDPLIARLEDSSTDVQHGAAWALGVIGDPRAIPALELLHDRTWNADVRKEAKRALTRFGRTPHA